MEKKPGDEKCVRCGAVFTCGMAAGMTTCWCADLPTVMPMPGASEGCLCPECLRKEIEQRNTGQDAGAPKDKI